MMKYQPTLTPIPFEHRADVNNKILAILDNEAIPADITKEDIYNGYTGIGGLHGLERKAYSSYSAYSDDKKEIEQGQFFTHASIIEFMVKDLQVQTTDTICDLSCGAGAFFNHFKETQCYGCDIDHKAIRVAKYLYPDANIQCCDIRYYEPGVEFDFVVGNPPFNLSWEVEAPNNRGNFEYLSQHYYCLKAAKLLKPGGILLIVVPDSYLKDEFFTKSMIAEIAMEYSFMFQYSLPATVFKNMGVDSFNTKVICFQRLAESIPVMEYHAHYIRPDQAKDILADMNTVRHNLRMALHRELLEKLHNKQSFGLTDKYGQPIRTLFMEKVQKLLYEIKHHKVLQPHFAKAVGKIQEFSKQKQPDGMKYEDWTKIRITENDLLAYLRRIMRIQTRKPMDVYRMVADKYGIRFKAYSKKAAIRMKKLETTTNWRWNDLILRGDHGPQEMTAGQRQSLRRRQKEYARQTMSWDIMQRIPGIDLYLRNFRFYNNEKTRCKFNEAQIHDLGLIMQKDFVILNWQQGSGKSAAAAVWCRYKPLRGTFIIGPALAINLTWKHFMDLHHKKYVMVKSLADINAIEEGDFVLISLDYVVKYKKALRELLKRNGHKFNLVFDESDEITNPLSKRTQATLAIFRRCRRKLLTTGTTTRNNITELYSQLELIYNNSVNMTCFCSYIYKEKKNDETNSYEITKEDNPRYRTPFPPRGGSILFKQCFNPAKTTVFGIQQHNQNIYNEESLRAILKYSIITRKFKEIAGDKYSIESVELRQNPSEEIVYTKIIHDLNEILPYYYNSTGNARKDAALRLVRQMQLLIDATSMPQSFREYEGDALPGKAIEIFRQVEEYQDIKLAIGCTSLKAVEWYSRQLADRYPFRPLFIVKGDVVFKKRGSTTAQFEATENGILLCTQQSLKSSVNIPTCNRVLIESKQWNIPKIEQFFFRFIRYDSKEFTEVVFLTYLNTIEVNLMALLLVKERLNDYIKTLEYREDSDIYQEYDIDLNILDSLITKEQDDEGRLKIQWGKAAVIRG